MSNVSSLSHHSSENVTRNRFRSDTSFGIVHLIATEHISQLKIIWELQYYPQ